MKKQVDIGMSNIFTDLVDYTKLHPTLVWSRCQYAAKELAILWANKKSVIDFYRDTDLYIFDLTKYQLILEAHNVIPMMVEQIKRFGGNRILEYGGGIGEFSILCNKADLDITYFDLDSKTKDYALWRFKKHDCEKIKIAIDEPLSQKWDFVNIMDVLEHLENPGEILSKLAKNTKYIFCNPEDIKYNIFFPQHISKFNADEYFERIEGYLWKNRKM